MAVKLGDIMILDLKKIKRSGKDESDFFFEYNPDKEIIDIPNVDFAGAVKINGTISLTGEHSAYIEGEVIFTLTGECTRCLKNTEQQFIIELKESVEQGDSEGYPVKNDTVDLTKMVDDLVAMNLPISFLCDENCKGLCPTCGANLNHDDCKCKINREGI